MRDYIKDYCTAQPKKRGGNHGESLSSMFSSENEPSQTVDESSFVDDERAPVADVMKKVCRHADEGIELYRRYQYDLLDIRCRKLE